MARQMTLMDLAHRLRSVMKFRIVGGRVELWNPAVANSGVTVRVQPLSPGKGWAPDRYVTPHSAVEPNTVHLYDSANMDGARGQDFLSRMGTDEIDWEA